MADPQEQFDDPALRGALQRACGKPVAPAHLQEKVAAMMATAAAVPAPRRASSRWRLPELPQITLRFAALAALVFMAVGFAVVQILSYAGDFLPHRVPSPQPAHFVATFATNVVKAHDNGARLTDPHLVPGDNFDALRAKLSQEEGLTVFAAALDGGWQFKGAGLSRIGDVKTAQLLFVREDETASVFTLPAESGGCSGGETYAQMENNHAIAGAARGSALYVVVVSKSANRQAPLADAQSVLSTVVCHLPDAQPSAAPSTR